MPAPFYDQIRKAQSDPALLAALDGNAERRRRARAQAYASLPEDWQVLRQRAHALRVHTIANLDRYLEQFISQAQSNGMQVHRAATAGQAVEIVLQIARQHGATRIAKAKTMVGEELDLNLALEKHGITSVETDLGEYIVQLRGEHPAHIITPAVHLSRLQVGETFHQKLGIPLTDDIPTLTSVARRVLRQTFLEAEIGVSGVNFAVAESGTLCLVTNEGNGRMVTTLPPVHIALLGMERLVPTLDDLALLLSLLPRSATGQKLSVYTSLLNGPRRPGEVDGPIERHIIVVDNGRAAVREGGDALLAGSLACIRCGACLNACPVFRELGGHAYVGTHGQPTPYPGPIGSVISPGLFGQAEFGHLARASTLCGACREACPVDINLPQLLLRVRAGEVTPAEGHTQSEHPDHVPGGLAAALRLYSFMAASSFRFTIAQKLAAIAGLVLAPSSGWLRLPALTGWGQSRDLPRPAGRSFRSRWKHISAPVQPGRPPDQRNYPAGESLRADPAGPTHASAPVDSGELPVDRTGLLASFADELVALGGTFRRVQEPDLAASVLSLLAARRLNTLLAWEAGGLPSGLLDYLHNAGLQILNSPQEAPDLLQKPESLAGLTGAVAALAETGSLLLTSGPGLPLSASLLPEIHIAVIRAEQIFERLGDVLALPQVRQSAAAVLITGPSRTADIEMTLTIGVHGPREVHVFCI